MSATVIGIAILVIVLVASVRLLRFALKRNSSFKVALLLGLQVACGGGLWLLLSPAQTVSTLEQLTVLSAAVLESQVAPGEGNIALPEAPSFEGVPRVPDLATALRQYPNVHSIRVIGAGLTARDVDAAERLRVIYEPSKDPIGLVDLHFTRRLPAGAVWKVSGRLESSAPAQFELLDPAGIRIAKTVSGEDGHFQMSAPLRVPGRMLYRLRVSQNDQPVDEVLLPIVVQPGQRARVLIVAGGSNAELKYLRRWAVDAGLDVRWSLALRPGVRVLSQQVQINPENLAQTDLLILDERAWTALRDSDRALILGTVDGGLGLLLRVTANVDARMRSSLASLGFSIEDADISRDVPWPLAAPANAGDAAAPETNRVSLTRRPIRVDAIDGVPLQRDAQAQTLALWRARGQGRMALWWFDASYRLVLEGQRSAHGEIWANAINVLTRPRTSAQTAIDTLDARVNTRVSLCGVEETSTITAPDATRINLLPDPRSLGCAAWWPAQSGWHDLNSATERQSLYVREADEAPDLLANAMRERTLALSARASDIAPTAAHKSPSPRSRRRWWFLFLLSCAALWWLERRWLRNPETAQTLMDHSPPKD